MFYFPLFVRFVQNPGLITSVASFTSEIESVWDNNEHIHYSCLLGLGTDQYAGPIKSHRSWILRLDEQTKSHWETFGTGTVGSKALWCGTLADCRWRVCVCVWRMLVWLLLCRASTGSHGQFSDVDNKRFSFGPHGWFGQNLQRI